MPSSASATPRYSSGTASPSSCGPRRARPRTWRCCAMQHRASTWPSCRAAATASDRPGTTRMRAAVAGQPVLRAGVAVLPRGRGPAPAQVAHADEPVAAAGLAPQRRHLGQRRAQPDGPAARGQCARAKALTLLQQGDRRRRWWPCSRARSTRMVFASAPESLMVQMLLRTPGVRLFDFAQAEAYSRRFAFLSPVVLPRGIVDLARDRPPQDVHLVAPTAMLVARDGTCIRRWCSCWCRRRSEVHGGAGWFQRKGDFPNTAQHRIRARTEADALLPQRRALVAALPAVLAGQPGRPHVGGADLHRRGADSRCRAWCRRCTSSASARACSAGTANCAGSKRRSASAQPTTCCVNSTRSGGAIERVHGAVVVCRRAVLVARPCRDGQATLAGSQRVVGGQAARRRCGADRR